MVGARALRGVLEPAGIPLLINDRVDVALAAEADGVHIGQDDMAAEDARLLLGRTAIIGLSVLLVIGRRPRRRRLSISITSTVGARVSRPVRRTTRTADRPRWLAPNCAALHARSADFHLRHLRHQFRQCR